MSGGIIGFLLSLLTFLSGDPIVWTLIAMILLVPFGTIFGGLFDVRKDRE